MRRVQCVNASVCVAYGCRRQEVAHQSLCVQSGWRGAIAVRARDLTRFVVQRAAAAKKLCAEEWCAVVQEGLPRQILACTRAAVIDRARCDDVTRSDLCGLRRAVCGRIRERTRAGACTVCTRVPIVRRSRDTAGLASAASRVHAVSAAVQIESLHRQSASRCLDRDALTRV
jgi:hypothetical protein